MGTTHDGELLAMWDPREGCWCLTCGQESGERRFMRNIKVDGEEEIWERFSLLPNENGQKYTIGKIFTSREKQGEFIYLSPDHFVSDTATVCEIYVENGRYFVSPTSRRSKVFINDVPVVKKTEVKFGQRLTLGNEDNVFLFKKRELDPDAFIYSAAKYRKYCQDLDERDVRGNKVKSKKEKVVCGDFAGGHNGLILSTILSYLPVEELKQVRFVSKLWNEEAFKLLRKRCTLSLDFERTQGYEAMNESMKLFRYAVEMGNNPISNWKIDLSPIGKRYALDPSPGKLGAKLLEDIDYFLFDNSAQLSNACRSVKTLKLGGTIAFLSDYKLRLKFLQALGSRLTELNWGGHWYLRASGGNCPFPENIQFYKLKVFNLSLCPLEEAGGWFDYAAKHCSNLTWLQPLIRSIKRVTTLRFACSASLTLEFLNVLSKPEIISLYSNLNELSLNKVTVDVIKILLKLDRPLKKLQIYALKDMKKPDFLYFEELLRKHCQTLESLLFIIPPTPVEDGDGTPPVSISFPTFPKLVNLIVGWGQKSYRKTLDIKLMFPDGSSFVNYAKDLPSLKSLTLWPAEFRNFGKTEDFTTMSADPDRVWRDYGYIFEMFFPPIATNGEMQICRSVQFLDVLHKVRFIVSRENPLFTKPKEILIARMFPNVENNEWITSIRTESSRIGGMKDEEEKPKISIHPSLTVEETIAGRLRSSNLIRNTRLRPRPTLAKQSNSRTLRTKKK